MRVLSKCDNMITKALTKGVSVGMKEHITKTLYVKEQQFCQNSLAISQIQSSTMSENHLCFGIAYKCIIPNINQNVDEINLQKIKK